MKDPRERNPPPPHLFDERMQLNYIVWHDDPVLEGVVRHVIASTKPARWIETGTHLGWTSMWVAENYPDLPIFTAEIDDGFHAKAAENLAAYSNVRLFHGDSREFLRSPDLPLGAGLSVFWLDAPLREECEVVAALDRHVCLIDDFACWAPDFPGDVFIPRDPLEGEPYLNDISYVSSFLGERYWRPVYPAKRGYRGYGLFVKGVDYVPPAGFMRQETLDEYIASCPKQDRPNDLNFVVHPLHPSCGR